MSTDLFRKIIKKAKLECNIKSVNLYNWSEPLLHPHLPELINIVHSYGIPCSISSNLNLDNNLESIMKTDLAAFYISVSGFTQSKYGRTHSGGNIDKVKNNMIALSEIKKKVRSKTHVSVIYHRYVDNIHDEYDMQQFAKNLGFEFKPVWALLVSFDKLLYYSRHFDSHENSPIEVKDMELLNLLALPLRDALKSAKLYAANSCKLRDNQIVLNVCGDVQLCCAVYDSNEFGIANYLQTPLDQIEQAKQTKDICVRCTSMGIPVYVTYGVPEYDEMAIKNIQRHKKENEVV